MFVDINLLDKWRSDREDSLNAYTIGDLANSKGFS